MSSDLDQIRASTEVVFATDSFNCLVKKETIFSKSIEFIAAPTDLTLQKIKTTSFAKLKWASSEALPKFNSMALQNILDYINDILESSKEGQELLVQIGTISAEITLMSVDTTNNGRILPVTEVLNQFS